ncbi:MAG: UbiD family decarboxylase [Planctomycetes bacterium]|nr:UbiD family decarboxylase [Planctomycetota bacterium]
MINPDTQPLTNLRQFLKLLGEKGLLKEINDRLDPNLEIPEIHRRVIERGGPALLFKNPRGCKFPLVTNLFGTLERVRLAFGARPTQFIQDLVTLSDEMMPLKMSTLWKSRHLAMQALKLGIKDGSQGPILNSGPVAPCFSQLPITTSWPEDGGPFITLPLVYTEHPTTGHHNLGMYRVQIYDDRTTGVHWQIGKGGGFHYHEAELLGRSLPVVIFNGGPPALMLSAIAPLPENVPELILTSLLMNSKVKRVRIPESPLPLISESEFAFVGEVAPKERRPEGPFGDHYGYYSLKHDHPVFRAKTFYHREDPIFSATVVGEPRQEDFYIGEYLQELLSPLFPKVMPAVRSLTTYGETGFHSLAAACVKVRYPKEALSTAFRILGEGQLSLTKVLMLCDEEKVYRPFDAFLEHVLARADFRSDLHIISQSSQDTLDYTGPKVNEGSKMILMATGEARYELELREPVSCPEGVKDMRVYCSGCLVVEAEASYEQRPKLAQDLVGEEALKAYRMILVVDSIEETLKDEMSFLWVIFTRFEPAADVYSSSITLNRFHPELEAPIAIDCRMKPWYPGKLVMSTDVVRNVDAKWDRLFLK